MEQWRALRQPEPQRLRHGVARNVGLGRLEGPPHMMDVAAPDPAPAVGGVEAVALGQPVLERAHGRVHDGTLSFRLVRNRGDGIRGVTSDPNLGTHSVTHVVATEPLARCTVVQCRLETGRTHQIRIHLAQIGHPVVGDALYGRDAAGPVIESPRTLLHAAYLSFTHPRDRRRLEFDDPLPEDFQGVIRRERSIPTSDAPKRRS